MLETTVIAPEHTLIDTSIVLATCSRAALLREALESLLTQDWAAAHAVEFVLVDDGSTDDTPVVLREFQQRALTEHGVAVTLLAGEHAGIAAARNMGFQAARGEWVASFDDDQIASGQWLRALRERASASNAAGVGGALALRLPPGVELVSLGPRTRGVLGEHLLGDTARPYRGGKDLPATNNALLRRDVFLHAGPFDIRYTEGGEDKDLFRRVLAAGHTLWFEPAARAEHVTPASRLESRNLRWTSLRLGAGDARIALASGGIAAALQLVVVRVAVLLLRDAPAWLRARLNHSQRAFLDAQCSLSYTEGLLRALPELLSPDHSRQTFLRSLDFRQRNGERVERTRRTERERP